MRNKIQYLSDPILFPFSICQKALMDSKPVFIKKPNDSIASQNHLLNEIRTLSKIADLPNVLLPLDLLDEKTIAYPFHENTLLNFVKKLSTEDLLAKVLKPLLYLLIQMHQKGIIHADIKLENIFYTEQNEIFLADFGKSVSSEFFQPNQIGALSQHQPADLTVSPIFDVYSVGVLTYQLLFGLNFMRDFQLKGRCFESIPETRNVSKKLLDFIHLATDLNALNRFSSAQTAFDFLFNDSEIAFEYPIVETYDLKSNFEIYLECMKQTFLASEHSLSRFDEFIGQYGQKYYERLEKWLRTDGTSLLQLKEKGQIIGILEASVQKNGIGIISTLFVHSKYRGRGIANLLMEKALSTFRDKKVTGMTLNVSKANHGAIKYYQKNGWHQQKNSIYPDAILFSKELS